MAFVRWRGNGAPLLASITVDGRPRQTLLANLPGAVHTTPSIAKAVAANFPDVMVDWAAVDQALAISPPTAELPSPQQQWAKTAHHLLSGRRTVQTMIPTIDRP